MKALITGATGFIGSNLVERLLSEGVEVRAMVRKSSNLQYLDPKRIEIKAADFFSPETLVDLVRGVDWVIHLAGVISAPSREGYFLPNLVGTRNLIEAVAKHSPQLKRFVFVSSIAAAGPADGLSPKTEVDEDCPVSQYGESKLGAERELLKFKDQVPVTILRPAIVYGPRDKGFFVIIKSVANRLVPAFPPSQRGGHKFYSFIHVEDVCEMIYKACIASPRPPSGEKFFACNDQHASFDEVIDEIAGQLRTRPYRIPVPRPLVWVVGAGCSAVSAITKWPLPMSLDKVNELLPDYWVFSNQKARDVLGYAPKYDLTSGLSATIAWYQRNGWI